VRQPWGGWPLSLDHVLGDAWLSDFEAQLEQFALDTWGAPQWILDSHAPDQGRENPRDNQFNSDLTLLRVENKSRGFDASKARVGNNQFFDSQSIRG
jgi:hypothetical protein